MVANAPQNGSPHSRARTWLFNPFHYIAGGHALALGVICIVVTGFVTSVSNSHFDGVLDFHPGLGLHFPLWVFLIEGLIDWLAFGIVLFAAGKLITRTRVRVVDVFGTQALARAPMLLTALVSLLPGFGRLTSALSRAIITPAGISAVETNAADVAMFALTALVSLTMLVWMVALMYRAYAVSCNVRGARAIVSFIIALLLAEVLSKLLLAGTVALAGSSVGQDADGLRLLAAAKNGEMQTVQDLLVKGVSAETKDAEGRTPLYWAAANGHQATTGILIAHGANVNAVDNAGRTPYDAAMAGAHPGTAQFLQSKGGVTGAGPTKQDPPATTTRAPSPPPTPLAPATLDIIDLCISYAKINNCV